MLSEWTETAASDVEVPDEVAAYYDEMQRFYQFFWHPAGVHYGWWREGTTSHDEAIRNMDRLVGSSLALPPDSRVLDAGCGIGGTCTTLADEFGLRVTGITISQDQLRRARRRTAALGLAEPPEYRLRPFTNTGFEPGSFDGIYGIESICYSHPRSRFLREARRLLRPGGRLVVLDGFTGESPDDSDRRDLQTFCDGFALQSLDTTQEFVAQALGAGFTDVHVTDLTPEVLPSARRILRLSRFGMACLWLARPWGPTRRVWAAHCRAGLVQRRLLERRAMVYCRITATC